MKTYRVSWEIDIAADSPRGAAEKAQAIQRDPESLATVFDVIEMDGDTIQRDPESLATVFDVIEMDGDTIQRIDLEDASDSLRANAEPRRRADLLPGSVSEEVDGRSGGRARADGVQQCSECVLAEEGPQA